MYSQCDAAGAYTFVGRTDDMFVCGGENIFRVRSSVCLSATTILWQACVVPVPDEIKGEKPFAFVVLRAGATLTEDGCNNALRSIMRPPINIRAAWCSCRNYPLPPPQGRSQGAAATCPRALAGV